ncbi:metallophosphoesterase [Sphingobacterium sp. BIGb0116]|uniref:metallophosphoesterase n=1 Tax=Sphingobacterium sp. BIGb0116 TaxID=2940619 RepID=UPI002168158E|nr:metallophosphoesterase [Sphingobacterium sp. BIGb0116]MCS4168512.1 orotate phosphoribosyltransferase-like protein [Sphingobacterium sp. BIGb0116]
MNDLILHFSDLHVSDQKGVISKAYTDTYLTLDEDKNANYINHILDKIKELSFKKRFLVITGDISNIAESREFDAAEKIIRLIMDELNIDPKQILLIPGDHDIHRHTVTAYYIEDKHISEIQKVKYNNFNKLYYAIKGEHFDSERLIFDHFIVDEMVFLAVNTNFNIMNQGGTGYLPTGQFETELKKFKEAYPRHELILCLHHNLEGEYEVSCHGQWDPENKKDLVTIFERHNIKCILNGNEHTPNSKYLAGREEIITSDAGPISAKTSISASFKIYEIDQTLGSLNMINRVFGLHSVKGQREGNYGNWIEIPADGIKNTDFKNFLLRKPPVASEVGPTDFLPDDEPDSLPALNVSPSQKIAKQDVQESEQLVEEIKILHSQAQTPKIIYEESLVQKKLYSIIKEKKLFHQGHFHWSETSRAHNWIDIARLLENKEDLYFAQNAIIDVLEKMNLIEGTDLIIGLGYEGNMIASKTSIKLPVPYTYMPYSYRWLDHNKFENDLHYDNEDKKYKKVILITDVVNDGRTIRRLVGREDRKKEFFDNVEKIVVVSLFYTGHQELNNDILNYNSLPEDLKDGDEEVNNIEFYTVQQLKIEKCPYGDDYKTECFILRDNLHCVHKFYTEE